MAKNIERYLLAGFDRTTAEYFASGRRRIVAVAPNSDYTLILDFDNGERRILDCKPMLQPGTVFAPLMQPEAFRRVYLDPQHCVAWDIDPTVDSEVVWSNKLDLCPDSCYLDSTPVQEVDNV